MSQWWHLGDGPVPQLAQLTSTGVDDAELRANQLRHAASIRRKQGDESTAKELESTAGQIDRIAEVIGAREFARSQEDPNTPEKVGRKGGSDADVVAALRELRAAQLANTDATRENTNATRDGARGPAAPASAGLSRRD